MSWLNFNSLNEIKGQISNFANTVLAEDIADNPKPAEGFSEQEVKVEAKTSNNEFHEKDSWLWSTDESKTDQLKTDETITNLKKRIVELENENRDLMTSLDQLDQNHQQNTEELVKMKSKLDEELEIVTEKYEILNMKYNKLALAENAYKKKINELKRENEGGSNQKSTDCEVLTKCKQLENEKSQLLEKVNVLETTNRSLETLLEDTNAAIDSKLSELASKNQQLETENKAFRIALQSKKELSINENTKIEYENKIKTLQIELEMLKAKENNQVHNKEMKEDQIKQNAVKQYDELLKKEEHVKYEQDIQELNNQLLSMKNESEEYQIELGEMRNDLRHCKLEHGKLLERNDELHEKYFMILGDNFRNYFTDDELKVDTIEDKEGLTSKFSNFMKNLSKTLGDFESNCQSLESKIFELNQSKTQLQNEKNGEIEKLIQNSEMLTQELLKKSKEIKDLEEECSQLMKNNDLLINKLTEPKDTGLQTIFESNEENVALLEEQLEMANEKIGVLEKSLTDNDSAKNQLNSSTYSDEVFEEETVSVHQFDKPVDNDLKDNLLKIERENESLKGFIENLERKLKEAEFERDNCRMIIDKMKLDFETTEYQFSEMNINLETLSEEIEKHKLKIDVLVSENENLKSLRNEDSIVGKELIVAKEELARYAASYKNSELKVNELKDELNIIEDNRELVEELRKELDTCCKDRSTLQKQFNDITNDSIQTKTDLENYKHENNNLKSLFFTIYSELNIQQNQEIGFEVTQIVENISELKQQVETLRKQNVQMTSEIIETRSKVLSSEKNEDSQKELDDLMKSRNELIAIVQTKHQETLTYHAEIQRLSEILKHETEKNVQLVNQVEELKLDVASKVIVDSKNAEIEKLTDQVDFLKQKCDVLAQNMLEEQQKCEREKMVFLEKEGSLSKKAERLQSHLMEVEEHYTQELLQSEQKIALLQARLNEVEKREKDSSTVYTSVSIRANQQNEALQQQLQSVTTHRDEIRKKLLELEDENNVKSAALSNLQLVLEQFQRDKEADVHRETDRIRKQMKLEKKIQEDLLNKIGSLETQIKESKQGLQAALRLTDQLEMSKNQVSSLREEVSVLTDKLNKKEEELKLIASQTDGKVDKSLIKNLIVGFVVSNKNFNKDQMQILKIIATVLDFNEQDHTKVNLNQAQQSNWLKSFLTPIAGDELPPHESLSRAFVNFLENESKPRVIPSLLPTDPPSETSSTRGSSTRTTPTPIVLNEIVLPTFSDFPQHRNSSSILKGVLKDNNT